MPRAIRWFLPEKRANPRGHGRCLQGLIARCGGNFPGLRDSSHSRSLNFCSGAADKRDMSSLCARFVRHSFSALLAMSALLVPAVPAAAQGFGVGARIAWVHPDTDVDVDAVRYVGGQIRLIGRRVGFEVSMDKHSESSDTLNQKFSETPIQASLLLRMSGGKVAPFLLGGPGWYRRKVEAINGGTDLAVSTTEFGWHAGIGLEILPSRHLGIHGDYRYTFLDFGKKNDSGGPPIIGGLLPGHRGSMWTLGATVYF